MTGVLQAVVPAGTTGRDGFALAITPEQAGWTYSGLRLVELAPGESLEFGTGTDEMVVLPLAGSATVDCDNLSVELTGRTGVFAGPTDFAYVPRDATVRLGSPAGGRFALPAARATRRLTARYGPVADVPVELRGAGQASRQVHNFCSPEVFDADRLIAVEVITPGGNWSSYPPHKHDQDREGESALEEMYYFEVASDGPAYQRVYSSGPDRQIDVCAEVTTGDVVLIPHGYHGPSMAAPGYDLYYLNVMAGPGERIWRFCDDPRHAWIRSTWVDLDVDPRLPLGTRSETT